MLFHFLPENVHDEQSTWWPWAGKFLCNCEMRARRRAVFRYPAQKRAPTRWKRGRRPRSRQALHIAYLVRTTAALCSIWRYAVLSCVVRTKPKLRQRGFSLWPLTCRSSSAAASWCIQLLSWRTTIKMQPRSVTFPPTSFSIRVDMVVVPCVLRACVLCAIVLNCAGWKILINISQTANNLSLANCMGLTGLFFLTMTVSQRKFHIAC